MLKQKCSWYINQRHPQNICQLMSLSDAVPSMCSAEMSPLCPPKYPSHFQSDAQPSVSPPAKIAIVYFN